MECCFLHVSLSLLVINLRSKHCSVWRAMNLTCAAACVLCLFSYLLRSHRHSDRNETLHYQVMKTVQDDMIPVCQRGTQPVRLSWTGTTNKTFISLCETGWIWPHTLFPHTCPNLQHPPYTEICSLKLHMIYLPHWLHLKAWGLRLSIFTT